MNVFSKKAIFGDTFTENGAISNSTTGNSCLDYYSKAGTYTNRSQKDVDKSMASIFAEDPKMALKIIFGVRLITRKSEFDETQTGFGRRDEFYKAMNWLARSNPKYLISNLHLIPIFGTWKDLIVLGCDPVIADVCLNDIFSVMNENIDNQLLLKFLPQIRSKSRCDRDKKRILFAKKFCKFAGMNYQGYRKLKSSGKAHIWQKQMSAGKWNEINFNGIPGKAMFRHISQKGKDQKTVFERHGLVKDLEKWVLSQENVKFTGYPYELLKAARKSPSYIQRLILDRQFTKILEGMENHKLGNVLAALDTSGSMGCQVLPGVSALDICMGLGIAFSSMNVGYFKNQVVMFNYKSTLKQLRGTFCEKVEQVPVNAMGSTNFQSIIDLICTVRKKHPEIPVEEYPQTILVVSDMQFNPAGDGTNHEKAVSKLKEVGLGKMRFIWWFVTGRGEDFPSTMDDEGVFLIGGFDPVNLKSLMTGKEVKTEEEKQKQNPMDGLNNWLSQSVFELLSY